MCFLILSPSLKHLCLPCLSLEVGKQWWASQPGVSLKEPWVAGCSFLPPPRTPRDRDTGKDTCRRVDCCAELIVPERNVGAEGWRQRCQRSLSRRFG